MSRRSVDRRSQVPRRRGRADVNQIAMTCQRRSGRRDLSARPEPATGHRAIWLQSFERKFSLFRVGHPVHTQPRWPKSISLRSGDLAWPGKRSASMDWAGMPCCRLQCTTKFLLYPRTGFSFAICATVAFNSSALKEGNEQMRLLQANAAGSPRSGYSTSGLGSLPSRRSSHSRRL